MIQIAIRMDDSGSCSSADDATLECLAHGVAFNVSVMVPGPTFPQFAPRLAKTNACVGLHVTLNSEWDKVKWGPVLGPNQVPSLVNENGHFLPSPVDLNNKGFSLEEAAREIEAQLAFGRSFGLHFSYIDEHMGVGWLPGLSNVIDRIANENNLNRLDKWKYLLHDQGLVAAIDSAPRGQHIVVTHPGKEAADMHQFFCGDIQPGQIARERSAETSILCSPELKAAILKRGAIPSRLA
jgi:chitin disaccharide deacetylase